LTLQIHQKRKEKTKKKGRKKKKKGRKKKGRGDFGTRRRQKRKLFRKAAVASTEIGMISRGSHQCIASFLRRENVLRHGYFVLGHTARHSSSELKSSYS